MALTDLAEVLQKHPSWGRHKWHLLKYFKGLRRANVI